MGSWRWVVRCDLSLFDGLVSIIIWVASWLWWLGMSSDFCRFIYWVCVGLVWWYFVLNLLVLGYFVLIMYWSWFF